MQKMKGFTYQDWHIYPELNRVTRGDQISFISAKTNKGLAAAFEKVPDLISKYLDTKKEEQKPVEV